MKLYIILIGVLVLGLIVGGVWTNKINTLNLLQEEREGIVKASGENGFNPYTPDSHTDCSIGSCVTTYYADRTFYEEDGSWKEINSTFYFNGTHYISDGNNFKVYVLGNRITIKGENESEVYFTIPTTNAPVVNGNIVSYDISTKGAIKLDAVLYITVTSESVEKMIVINSITTNSNSIKYAEEFNEALSKSRFITSDLKIWYTMSNATNSWNVYYPINWIRNGQNIELELNKTWFSTATYPIYVDPTVTYNFTNQTSNRAYGASQNTTHFSSGLANDFVLTNAPTFVETWGVGVNATALGYSNIKASNNLYAGLLSTAAGKEPFAYFNFTIAEAKTDIQWINVSIEQSEILGTQTQATESCYSGIADFGSNIWVQFGDLIDGSTDLIRTYNYTDSTNITNIINSAGVLSILAWGQGMDNTEGCKVDYVQVQVGYNLPPEVTLNTTNTTSFTTSTPTLNFTGIDVDGNDVEYNIQVDSSNDFKSISWDVSTAVNTINKSIIGQDIDMRGIFINSSGTGMYLVGITGDNVYQYQLSTPWDVSTAVNTINKSIIGQDGSMRDIFLNSSGTGMYLVGLLNDNVYQYQLSTPWDVSTAVNTINKSIIGQDIDMTGIFLNSSGTGMYLVGITGDKVYQYQLSTPWDVSTAVNTINKSIIGQDTSMQGIFLNSSGTGMYLVGFLNDKVYQYQLSTPWDVSTAVNTINKSIIGQDENMQGIFLNSSGTGMYLVGITGDKVYQYSVGGSLFDKYSTIDTGFFNTVTPSDTHPFTQGNMVNYTVQTSLSDGTYYWQVRANDTFSSNHYGAWSETRQFTITSVDTSPPQWSSNSTNSTTAGTLINHSLVWTDTGGLANFTFSFDNGTGTLANDSSVSMTGTSNQSSVLKFVNQTIGSTIRWQVWAWDITGNSNGTVLFSYLTTGAPTNCWTNDTVNKLLIIPNGCVFQGSLGV